MCSAAIGQSAAHTRWVVPKGLSNDGEPPVRYPRGQPLGSGGSGPADVGLPQDPVQVSSIDQHLGNLDIELLGGEAIVSRDDEAIMSRAGILREAGDGVDAVPGVGAAKVGKVSQQLSQPATAFQGLVQGPELPEIEHEQDRPCAHCRRKG
jgi:hypothetical protein